MDGGDPRYASGESKSSGPMARWWTTTTGARARRWTCCGCSRWTTTGRCRSRRSSASCWPDAPESRARASLRTAASQIRHATGCNRYCPCQPAASWSWSGPRWTSTSSAPPWPRSGRPSTTATTRACSTWRSPSSTSTPATSTPTMHDSTWATQERELLRQKRFQALMAAAGTAGGRGPVARHHRLRQRGDPGPPYRREPAPLADAGPGRARGDRRRAAGLRVLPEPPGRGAGRRPLAADARPPRAAPARQPRPEAAPSPRGAGPPNGTSTSSGPSPETSRRTSRRRSRSTAEAGRSRSNQPAPGRLAGEDGAVELPPPGLDDTGHNGTSCVRPAPWPWAAPPRAWARDRVAGAGAPRASRCPVSSRTTIGRRPVESLVPELQLRVAVVRPGCPDHREVGDAPARVQRPGQVVGKSGEACRCSANASYDASRGRHSGRIGPCSGQDHPRPCPVRRPGWRTGGTLAPSDMLPPWWRGRTRQSSSAARPETPARGEHRDRRGVEPEERPSVTGRSSQRAVKARSAWPWPKTSTGPVAARTRPITRRAAPAPRRRSPPREQGLRPRVHARLLDRRRTSS